MKEKLRKEIKSLYKGYSEQALLRELEVCTNNRERNHALIEVIMGDIKNNYEKVFGTNSVYYAEAIRDCLKNFDEKVKECADYAETIDIVQAELRRRKRNKSSEEE